MSEFVLRHVKITDPGGPHHDEVADILVKDGRIDRIDARLKSNAHEVRIAGLHLSPGWVDLRAHFRDPGQEWKQGIPNGLDSAAAGGFTTVCVLPSTDPVIDGRSGVEYVQRKAAGHAVRLLPLGAITKGLKGEQLAELHDMQLAGAAGFSDDQRAIRNSRLMLLALQYVNGLPGAPLPVMSWPQDPDLSAFGLMHEGPMSTRLGMKGLPAIAETMQLARDLALLEYAGGHLHASTISTAASVDLIRQAKARKLKVTASVAAHNLLLDDGCLRGFETCYKVLPPLRDATHIAALREGVKDGTIDAIVSDHRPEDREHKVLEFGPAAFGIIGLETAFAAANTALKGGMSLRRIIERFSHGPRAVLGLPVVHVEERSPADLTLFDPEADWTCAENDLPSRSHNTPFLGQRFAGRPVGIVGNGQLKLAPAFASAAAN
ncbi:MAG: dihydroorotase [Flavobacteriales bacterium]|nr:dihydroorotase [Flavobacteriales bacterium]